ncbi:MAG TPA: YdcF family protein [Caulobacteraceae bacterium]|nr:YdcF family protein [Caulobacteraceae bacterium]
MKGLAVILVALAIWAAGLLAFADRIARLTPAQDPPEADGIVALTGASDLRLAAAARLLQDGKGERLLVSGVNRRTTRQDVLGVTGATKRLFDCCVDLGFTAADTIGNGREAAEWARSMRYRRLILVTADFHMPRAMLELHSAMPEARVTPYPVATPALDARRWWATGEGARRMTLEYSKYLAILTREAILGLGPRPGPPKAGGPPA